MTKLTRARIAGLLELLGDEASILHGDARDMPQSIYSGKKIKDTSFQNLIDVHKRIGNLLGMLTKSQDASSKPAETNSNDVQARIDGLHKMLLAAQDELNDIGKLPMSPHIKDKLALCDFALSSGVKHLVDKKNDPAHEHDAITGIDDAINRALQDDLLSIYKVYVSRVNEPSEPGDGIYIAVASNSDHAARTEAADNTPLIVDDGFNITPYAAEMIISREVVSAIDASIHNMAGMDVRAALIDLYGEDFADSLNDKVTRRDIVVMILKTLYQEPEKIDWVIINMPFDGGLQPM